VRVDGPYRVITLADGSEITCHALVAAVGLSYSKLDIPGVDNLIGSGVYYGASITEAISCTDNPVFIVGAGNSAGQAAIYLAQYASKVVMVVRGSSLESKCSQYLVDRILQTPNIEVLLDSIVMAVHGEDHVEAVTVCNIKTNVEEKLPGAGLFIFIGAVPSTDWLKGVVKMDSRGFVCTGPQLIEDGKPPKDWPLERDPFLLETSVPGIFVVGDARANSVKRVASAVGEGSIAVQFVHQYLAEGR
jgi:thioredoxin reductase (NADPH)